MGGLLSEYNHVRTGSAENSDVLFRIGAVEEEAKGRDDILDD